MPSFVLQAILVEKRDGAGMDGFSISGGCQCGTVRYRVRAPAERTTHCHCSMCRKMHGALFATFSAFPRRSFSLEGGADALCVFRSSPGVRRIFCGRCGCPLFFDYDGGEDVVDVATGTIDGGAHPGHAPAHEGHIYVASKVPWLRLNDGLRQWPEGHDL